MKVTFLMPSVSRLGGGLFPASRALTQALRQHGDVDISVIGLTDAHTKDDIDTWEEVRTVACSTVGPSSFGFAPDMQSTLRDEDPLITHHVGLWQYPSVAGHRWAKQHRRPYIVSPHGMLEDWALSNASWKKRIAGWLYENDHLRQATCIHALNPAEAQAIRDYGLSNPICVIPNGVELPDAEVTDEESPGEEFSDEGLPDEGRVGSEDRTPVPRARTSRPKDPASIPWGNAVGEGARVLLFLGRIHPKKGLDQLISAWERAMIEGWHLAIVGWDDGGHEPELKRQVHRLGLSDTVHFMGPMYNGEKEAAFRHADAFVLPSFSEGLPMAVLEAWSYRLPVLMTSACNIPEGFEANAALRIAPDVDAIDQGLREFAAMSNAQRVQMGQRGRNLVQKNFTWRRVAEQMYEVYRWMCGRATEPSCVRGSA